jgi:Protein of unknown function (DUF1674)
MGTRTLMSTLGAADLGRLSIRVANGRFADFAQSSIYISVFSGKLSPVTTLSEDQIRVEPVPTPVRGELPAAAAPREVGGREGPEPTRFGDWELRGRCIDF